MDWRAGAWVVPWFVLLLITSLLSPYGGGLGAWGTAGYGFAVQLGVSLIIYSLAHRVRLSPQQAAHYVARASDTGSGGTTIEAT